MATNRHPRATRTRREHGPATREQENAYRERARVTQRAREALQRERDAAPRVMSDTRHALALVDEIEERLYALDALTAAPAWLEIEDDEETGQVGHCRAFAHGDLAYGVTLARAHMLAVLARAERLAAGLES